MLSPPASPLRSGKLRVRITERLSGSIDGIQLDRFRHDCVYEVGTSLGSYLLAIGAAEPVADDIAAMILPPEQQMFGPVGHKPVVREKAADQKKRR